MGRVRVELEVVREGEVLEERESEWGKEGRRGGTEHEGEGVHATVVVVVGARKGYWRTWMGWVMVLRVWRWRIWIFWIFGGQRRGEGERKKTQEWDRQRRRGVLGAVDGREEVEGLDDEGVSGWQDLDEEGAGRGRKWSREGTEVEGCSGGGIHPADLCCRKI